MSAKIISVRSVHLLLVLLVIVAGCTPAGPRALLKGKKYLDQGDYPAAVEQFKTAASLMATNAAVWNYYGVALQYAGQPVESANAYLRALSLDRDLLEARLNLGILQLEQNHPDAAKTELTAYTLRRPNDPGGWLKLGSAQLKLGETASAERSFSTVYHLDTNNVEALNGFGLARMQRNRPREAAQFFAVAVQLQPNYGPALLNLGAVYEQYFHDNAVALKYYQAYLALNPRPANWEAVNALAHSLEQSLATTSTPTPAPAPEPATPAPKPITTMAETRTPTRTSTPAPVRSAPAPRGAAGKPEPIPAPRTATHVPTQVMQVAPEPKLVTTPQPAAPPARPNPPAAATEPATTEPPAEPAAKPGLWQRWFGSSQPATPAPSSEYIANGVTPLPGASGKAAAAPAKPAPAPAPTPIKLSRYGYLHPAKPAPGNRRAASGAFTQARLAEQNEKWGAALNAYRQAADLDPSWFEASYNAAVMAQRLQNYASALASYEQALAIEPDSVNARYNFALSLKNAGYALDAANELQKILAENPAETRAHLALANLYAQQLHDPAQARVHYQKVLELDPNNPQASEIRFWLAGNPG